MTNTQNIDKSNLRQVILDFPKQFEIGFELAKNIKIKGNFKSVIISGMGGSSLPVDILRTYVNYLYQKNPKKNKLFNIYQNRTYNLPLEAYDNCLNIFSSFSGTTEETLSSLTEGIKNKLPGIGIANGGNLIKICEKKNLPLIKLPPVIQPRYATGYFFAAMLQILANSKLIEDDFEEIVSSAEKLEKITVSLEEEGKSIARRLAGKTPVIYASDKYKSVAMIWKIKINENAKTPAFYNVYPELSHNEMVGFTLPQAKFHILTLMDKKDHPQVIKRMEITAQLLKRKSINTTFIDVAGNNFFETIFSALILGDWVSYYLALAYNQDPTPVDMVEDLKKLLA